MTRKQKQVFDHIRRFVRDEGYFPSIRELGTLLGHLSPATTHTYIRRLEKDGKLIKDGRTWRLASQELRIPMVGVVPAGPSNEMFESLGEVVDVPPNFVHGDGDRLMAFRVDGDSMKDAFVQTGDVVVVRRTPAASVGDMVVANLTEEGGITLKRLMRGRDGFYLKPENPEYPDIPGPFEILGKVRGILRTFR